MTPANFASKVFGSFAVFRRERDAVEQHARHLGAGHAMVLGPMDLSHEAVPEPGVALAGGLQRTCRTNCSRRYSVLGRQARR